MKDSLLPIKKFADNHMQVKPDKSQAIVVGKRNLTFNLDNNIIKYMENVKLLGVTIGSQLEFSIYTYQMYAQII